ncbi:MAG: hypothetical protein ACNA7J_00305 [Wenzhouxiangella sp.]
MRLKMALMVLVGSSAMLLGACYESSEVNRYEPGVYKGQQDPLVSKLESDDELREKLNNRFDGQRDR